MKAKELAELLLRNPEAEVCVSVGNEDGCETCGYGETYSEDSVVGVTDLETRLILVIEGETA